MKGRHENDRKVTDNDRNFFNVPENDRKLSENGRMNRKFLSVTK